MSPSKRFPRSRQWTMLLSGLLSLALWGLAAASPAANVATLRDWNGHVICCIDDAGNLSLQGSLIQNAGTITPNPAARESYLQDPGSGQTLALYALDGPAWGQLKIKGALHVHSTPSASHLSCFKNQSGTVVASFTAGGDLYLLGGCFNLTAPSGLTASASSSAQIDLAWTDNAADEEGYFIERSTDGTSFTQIATVPANTTRYSDSGAYRLTRSYYRVWAYHGSAIAGPSNTASACLLAPPWAVQATMVSDTQLSVTWHAVSGATQYTVWRAQAVDTTPTLIATTAGLWLLDGPGLTPGTTYYYTVRAVNSGAVSDPSVPAVGVTRTCPPAMGTVAVQTLSNFSLRLSWPPSSGATGGYKILRSTDQYTSYSQVGTCREAFFIDTSGLSEATCYWYVVLACGESGDSAASLPVSGWTAPNPPSGLLVRADDATTPTRCLQVSWVDNSDKEKDFVLERSPNGADTWTSVTLGPSDGHGATVVYRDTRGTSEGVHYWYRVKARLTQAP